MIACIGGVMRRADLVESLATVAISTLSGPLGQVGVAVAKELVKYSKSAWSGQSDERTLKGALHNPGCSWGVGVIGESVCR
jgi:hypothetical protein